MTKIQIAVDRVGNDLFHSRLPNPQMEKRSSRPEECSEVKRTLSTQALAYWTEVNATDGHGWKLPNPCESVKIRG